MRILITGSSGFIGRNLVEKFKDKYSIFYPTHAELDLLDESKPSNFISRNKIDTIIHCANKGDYGITSFGYSNDNVRMFRNITESSSKVSKIIFLGSGAEYGKERNLKNVRESDFGKVVPKNKYGYEKFLCSRIIERSSDNIVNLRLFGVYGKDEKRRFISTSIKKNLENHSIIIKQNVYFDYLYVDDLVKIIDWFLNNQSVFKFYNCTSGKSVDLISLANIINEVSGKPSELDILEQGLDYEYSGNNARLLRELGDFQFTSHKDGIISLYDYYAK